VRDVLLFLIKFLVLSAALFAAFTAVDDVYYGILARVTAVTAPLTGASVKVLNVEGNSMTFEYAGRVVSERLVFAAFNPVILISLLLATPRLGRRTLIAGIGGLAILLVAQVVTLRLLLAIDVRGYRASPGLEPLEVLTLASICVNWVLPIVVWIAWVPTGFLARALKAESP
jgi:hypothetical protein